MRKVGWGVVSAAVLAVMVVFFVQRFRIQPLTSIPEKHVHVQWIYPVSNPECAPTDTDRLAILDHVADAEKQHSFVILSKEKIPSETAEQRFKLIFSTRAERKIYIVDATAINEPDRSELLKLVSHSDMVDTVCIIDPRNPPAWYPPPLRTTTK